MTPKDRKTLERAAAMIDQEADLLRESHTIAGKWPKSEASIKRRHDEMRTVALLVYCIANVSQPKKGK